jgi:hypothetical protein
VDAPYSSESELCGGAVRDVLLITLHPLLENVPQTICRKLQEDSGTGGFDLLITLKFLLKRFHHFKTAARLIASSP